jgi:hypothetical protein
MFSGLGLPGPSQRKRDRQREREREREKTGEFSNCPFGMLQSLRAVAQKLQ